MGRYWLGIDIGGTFTDFTLYDTATHGVTGLKVPSTPPDFARAVEHGLDASPASTASTCARSTSPSTAPPSP